MGVDDADGELSGLDSFWPLLLLLLVLLLLLLVVLLLLLPLVWRSEAVSTKTEMTLSAPCC